MLFSPELARKVLAGEKTDTRRRIRGQPIRYQVGRTYAVQPGRGNRHVGHIKVWGVKQERLCEISGFEAQREGFRSIGDFMAYWMHLYGTWNPGEVVAVIDFQMVPRCPDCQVLDG